MQNGWKFASYSLPVVHFFVPFLFLLSRHVKRNPKALALGAVWILVVHAYDLFYVIMPNIGAHSGGEGGHHGPPHFGIAPVDIAAFVGIGGVFLAAFGFFLKKNKIIAVGDPRLAESMAHENY
jgi:hypothetical protein